MIAIALGGNLDWQGLSTPDIFLLACRQLQDRGIIPYRMSHLYQTRPIGPPQDNYYNAVILVRYLRSPHGLMRTLHQLENSFQRQRTQRWGARTLDLDLIDFHGKTMCGRLEIPHPRLVDRAFVLYPLRDVAPHWRHPITQQTIDELIRGLPASARRGIIHRSSGRFSLQKEDDAPKNHA